jgi:AcrR family transcriptional regulator
VSEQSRRAQKKALTRAHVRATAHRLFSERGFDAVTIADVAAAAGVAVQTVFNHFTTKEELYWSGRSPWVTAPAVAVRDRAPGTPALTALREHLAADTARYVERLATAEGRSSTGALERSPTLRAAERELHHEAERLLAAALEDAWTGPDAERPAPADPRLTAGVVAATWLAATRTLVTTLRDPLPRPEDVPDLTARTRAVTDRLLTGLQQGLDARLGTGLAGGTRDRGTQHDDTHREAAHREATHRDGEGPGVLRAV